MKRFFMLMMGLGALCIISAFNINSNNIQSLLKDKYAWVDSGDVLLNRAPLKIRGFELGNGQNNSTVKQVSAFYISKYEVTNFEYMEFLNAIKKEGKMELYESVTVDSTGWINNVSYASRYVEYYHKHPAYNNYPVVNVSYKGAKAYCEWLGGKISSTLESGQSVSFRLPTREEWWIRAARADNHHYAYCWGESGIYKKNGEKKCNFKEYNSEEIKTEAKHNVQGKKRVVVGTMNRLRSNVSVTKQVQSFDANSFGLYNMNGNVAEMIDERNVALGGSWGSFEDEVTLDSDLEYKASSPFVGFRPVMIVN